MLEEERFSVQTYKVDLTPKNAMNSVRYNGNVLGHLVGSVDQALLLLPVVTVRYLGEQAAYLPVVLPRMKRLSLQAMSSQGVACFLVLAQRYLLIRNAGILISRLARHLVSLEFLRLWMLDATKVLSTIERASGLFRKTRGRSGSTIVIPADSISDIVVIGDLHGHIEVFSKVLKLSNLQAHPQRHFVVQELAHDTRVNPDEGHIDRSHRLISLVCALKCQYPDRVHYLLGNHELSELTGRSISKNGFAINTIFAHGVEADVGERAPEFMQAYRSLFASLPVLIRLPNQVVLCHTLPEGRDMGRLDLSVLTADSWPGESLKRGGTVYAMTWGRDTSQGTADQFAQLIQADLFVTGHQPCHEGFRQANHRQVIIDGTEPNPSYCVFDASRPISIEGIMAGCHRVPLG